MRQQAESRSALRLGWALVAGLGFASPASAQCLGDETQQIVGSNVAIVDFFGSSAASADDVAVIGSPLHNVASDRNVGEAYVYRLGGGVWVEEALLTPSDPQEDDEFGIAVDTDGSVIVVGSNQFSATTQDHGKADVFRWNGAAWVHEQELTASDGADGDEFGLAVAVDRSRIAVGAPGDDTVLDQSGTVYVFEHDGSVWNEVQVLTASNPTFNGLYGAALDLDGGALMVGSQNDVTGGNNAGAVYVYDHDGSSFVQTQLLTPSNSGPHFGLSLDRDGPRAIVGGDDAAYTLELSGGLWSETQILLGSDMGANDVFGHAVAVEGTLACVGAHMHDHQGVSDTGAAYTFRHDGNQWLEVQKLLPAVPQADSEFGFAATILADHVLVGANQDSTFGLAAGAAYAFDVPVLALDVQPDTVNLGDALTLKNCGGSPGHLARTYVVDVNGLPFFYSLFTGSFDAAGSWDQPLLVPNDPSLSGLVLTLRTFASSFASGILQSNDEVLTIL